MPKQILILNHGKAIYNQTFQKFFGRTSQNFSTAIWYPTKLEDIDLFENRLLTKGNGIEDYDHPAFTDLSYIYRKEEITNVAKTYKLSHARIPFIHYNRNEQITWKVCFKELSRLHKLHACREYLDSVEEFQKTFSFSENEIPQMEDISQYLLSKTGWQLKPVAGLLSQRDFLNGLAFKVFHCTQYIRHHDSPFYSVEPDIIHEYIGHTPMFANNEFAEFSNLLGLASLGASDEEIKRLGAIYWYTVEFGVCKQENQTKVFGAGILAGVKDIEYCFSSNPTFVPLDSNLIAQKHLSYGIAETRSPLYFISDSFAHAKEQVLKYCLNIDSPGARMIRKIISLKSYANVTN